MHAHAAPHCWEEHARETVTGRLQGSAVPAQAAVPWRARVLPRLRIQSPLPSPSPLQPWQGKQHPITIPQARGQLGALGEGFFTLVGISFR